MCKQSLSLYIIILIGFSSVLASAAAQDLPDPTRPPGAKVSSSTNPKRAQNWTLSSTLITNGRRNAIINGQLVTIGQIINHAKVISIQPNEVWLLHKQKRIRIKLLAQEIKDFSPSAAK